MVRFSFDARNGETDMVDGDDVTSGEGDDFVSPPSVFFSRGSLRSLVLWHVVTCGFYDLFWFYRQWRAHERPFGKQISAQSKTTVLLP